jgi:hypothetical protein
MRRIFPISFSGIHSKKAYMNPDQGERQTAQEGLQRIEDAILRLLHRNPDGLRNSRIAEVLNLRSDFRGRQKDYLTYSILGGLLARGKVIWDQKTKLFNKAE